MTTALWQPKNPEMTQMWQFMRFVEKAYHLRLPHYQQLHAWSVQNPALFWASLCDFFDINFDTPASQILSGDDMMSARWFSGATFNFAEKLLTRKDTHPAIVSLDERGTRQVLSYNALRAQVSSCAAGLRKAGVVAGDRVGAIMPNVAMTIIAMLATTSIGAVWSVCSPDFGACAAVDRLGQIEPKILFACDGQDYQGKTHDVWDNVLQLAAMIPSLTHLVVCPIINRNINLNATPIAIAWDDFLIQTPELHFTPMPFSHPLYILFSSGTTGKPKCIIHGAGGTLLQHIKELALHTDLQAHDNLFFYTTCGWMMWNWEVSILALGATLTLYDGAPNYPSTKRLFEIIDQEKVTVFGTSAKFISSVEKANESPRHDVPMQHLRCILSTGSPLLPKNYDFVYQHIKADVQLSSISGGTDIVSCFALGNPILPVYRGELQCLGLGMAVEVYDEQGDSIQEARGELVCTKPFPSMPIGFGNDPDSSRYYNAYFARFPGIWAHGDFAEITAHQGLIIYGRSDTILNPGGVRIGTAEIYRQIESIPEIVDSVVIGQDWQDDVRVVLFLKLRKGLQLDDALQDTIRKTIRNNASPRHVPAKILQVADVPRTISGKTMEVAVRQTVHGQAINNLQSLANPEALDCFRGRVELEE